MRTPLAHVAKDGTTTYKVKFRLGDKYTSQTFRRKADAATFAAFLAGGGPTAALAWLESRDTKVTTLTFAQWFAIYVDQLTGVTERTRGDYRSMHRRYLSGLDDTPLPLITRRHITSIVNDLDRAGRAPKTIKQAIHMLSTALQLAVDEGHIAANPCRKVRLPKQSAVDGVRPRFLTQEEASRLVAATPDHYRPLVVFLLASGLRWSEATALQGRHVDLANGTVRVEQAWKRVPGEGLVIGVPKSQKATRTVNTGVPGLLALEPLVRGPNDYIFLTRSGGTVSHANFFNNVWRPACKRAGLNPPPRIHDTRHTFASWLISDGISLEAVQDQLGHESILTTRKVYAQLLPALGVAVGRSASAAMERVLEGTRTLPELSPPDQPA